MDTNVWLERLLDQEKSDIAGKFFDITPTNKLFVSDFSMHSIGVILSRLKKYEVFEKFLEDLFINGQIELLVSYQLSVAQKYDLVLISFDKDFNISGLKKNTPDQIIDAK